MDLDEEELKATRKLNVVDKKSIIEKDINILKGFNPGDERTEEIKQAIDHILAEREADKKRIKKLEEKLLDMIKGTETINKETTKETSEYIKQNYIPVQKVKDKIEENKRLIDETDSEDIMQKLTDENETLQELLEDK